MFIYFVNQLVDCFFDKMIFMLAYFYSMYLFRYFRFCLNVNIMLCSIDVKWEVLLIDNVIGQDFVKVFKGWVEIFDNIFVWDYGINFDNLVVFFFNFYVLQFNMELFYWYNVCMYFVQVGGKWGEDFLELWAYMFLCLFWSFY